MNSGHGCILLWVAALCASCAHQKPNAGRLFVAGKAYLCSDAYARGKFAVGKTVRLMGGNQVLAEDVVGPDGSFVLHPRQDQPVEGRIYLDAEGKQLSLANDYASWLQDHLHYRAEVQFACEAPTPAAPPVDRSEPVNEPMTRPPPAQLIPKRPL